jgi:hypothetical protein
VSGSGQFLCEGPALFLGGANIQKIVIGSGSGLFQLSEDGGVFFAKENGENSGYFDFAKGSKGRISLRGRDKAYFDNLVAEGRIRIEGSPAQAKQFVFRQDGSLGEYRLAP